MMRPVSFLAALIASVTFLCSTSRPAFADDWPQFRGPNYDGVSVETDWQDQWPESGPPIAWKKNVGVGISGIVVSDDRLYTMGNVDDVDVVRCLKTDNGNEVWSVKYNCPADPNEFEGGPTATPTVDGDDLYTISRVGDVHCIDKVTGEIKWRVDVSELADVRIPGWGFAGSPFVSDEKLLFNVGDAGVALNKKTGKLIWGSADKDSGYSSIVPLGDGTAVFGSARSYVCVSIETGREVWRQKWLTTFGCNAADPVVRGNLVFLSTGYNRGCALLKRTDQGAEVLWKNKDMQNQISCSVTDGNFLFGVHGDVDAGTQLRCMDLLSGDVKWSDDSIHPGAVSATKQHLIVLTLSGELLVGKLSSREFLPTARHQVVDGKCWTAPVLSGGRIYCRTVDGELACVDVRRSAKQ